MAKTAERFSKVFRGMWRDPRFLQLSKPQPNARDLYQYLLTGPHNTGIPGLFALGAYTIFEELGWPVEDIYACMQELVEADFAKFDRVARLVWLIDPIADDPPRSPNVVTGWAGSWNELPDCALRDEAAAYIANHLKTMGESLAETFAEVTAISYRKKRQGLSERPAKVFPKENSLPSRIQEQEQEQEQIQEQEQEQQKPREAPAAAAAVPPWGGEEQTLAREIQKYPVFASLDAAAIAQGVAGHMLHKPQLRMEWVLAAIEQCATKSVGLGLTREALQHKLVGFMHNAKGPRDPPSGVHRTLARVQPAAEKPAWKAAKEIR